MTDWRAILAIVIVVAGGLGAAYFMRGGPNNANHPEGVMMICGACGHTWPVTMKQISDHHVAHYGEPLTCPKCAAAAGVAAGKEPGFSNWVKQNELDPHPADRSEATP